MRRMATRSSFRVNARRTCDGECMGEAPVVGVTRSQTGHLPCMRQWLGRCALRGRGIGPRWRASGRLGGHGSCSLRGREWALLGCAGVGQGEMPPAPPDESEDVPLGFSGGWGLQRCRQNPGKRQCLPGPRVTRDTDLVLGRFSGVGRGVCRCCRNGRLRCHSRRAGWHTG
jgi:hypothetical protein